MIEDNNLPVLPENWTWVKLIEICSTTSGGTPSRKNPDYYNGNIPWLKSGELNNNIITSIEENINEEALNNSSAKIIPKGTLLIALYGATAGKLGILGLDSSINQAICAIFTPENMEKKYLFWYLMQIRNSLLQKRIGGAQPNLTQKMINDIMIPFPPFPEQKRIVSKIEELFTKLDDSIKDLKSVKRKLDVYRKSVLKVAFKGKQTKELKEFCDDVKADIVDGPFGSNMKRSDYITEGFPVLKIQNIKPFNIVIKKMDYINKEKYDELKRHSFKSGDVILTKLGDPLGVSAIVPKDLDSGIIVADLVRVRANKINNDYLVYVLNSPFISNYINSKQKGTTRPRVNLSIVRELPIPYVEPEEQERMVQEIESCFSVIDKLEETVDDVLIKQEHLRKSILKRAFEGRLVPQDPTDESADQLLKRIQKENRKYEQMRLT